ncbi:MAG: hypothetical protein COX57_11165 [Alphaproteobacteria bacterium CG_4_10_14_0_2_um_filter_63_37]|nr:MAG: hypothetical protein AUJ55_08610 [Proteobacteria bacterium CG1_02_64_396]PJA23858.1 MAG: hypothetical protein COX57_11165 [Alphaproteobacteria bacterium CG_4_10_14_0_2_um_filter_63_37]
MLTTLLALPLLLSSLSAQAVEFLEAWPPQGEEAKKLLDEAPQGIALDNHGRVWVALPDADSPIGMIDPDLNKLIPLRIKGGELDKPVDLAFSPLGLLWVIDQGADAVVILDTGGRITQRIEGTLDNPSSIVFDAQGNAFVTDSGNERIVVFNPQGVQLRAVTPSGRRYSLDQPVSVAILDNGSVAILDPGDERIVLVDNFGGTSQLGGDAFEFPGAVAIASLTDRRLVVAQEDGVVRIVSPGGQDLAKFGSSGKGISQFGEISRIRLDAWGRLWIADAKNQRVSAFRIDSVPPLQAIGAYSQPPERPVDIATVDERDGLWLNWETPENHAVSHYIVERGENIDAVGSRGFKVVATTLEPQFRDTLAPQATVLSYQVKTVDMTGRQSMPTASRPIERATAHLRGRFTIALQNDGSIGGSEIAQLRKALVEHPAFDLVERGEGLRGAMQEQRLLASGLAGGANNEAQLAGAELIALTKTTGEGQVYVSLTDVASGRVVAESLRDPGHATTIVDDIFDQLARNLGEIKGEIQGFEPGLQLDIYQAQDRRRIARIPLSSGRFLVRSVPLGSYIVEVSTLRSDLTMPQAYQVTLSADYTRLELPTLIIQRK